MKLPVCPDCGLSPEFSWKNYTFGSCSVSLMCPYEHHRVEHSYWAGGKANARKAIEKKWVSEVTNGEVKNG